jgi:hypothetical protein
VRIQVLIVLFFSMAPLCVVAQSVSASYVQTFKNNLFLSCSREISSGSDPFPTDLSMQVCSCAAGSIVSSFSARQLQRIEGDIANNYASLTPYIEQCVQEETPKYMDSHPEFLHEYMRKHPELLRQ